MEWMAMKFRWKMYGTEIIQKARPKSKKVDICKKISIGD